MSEEYTQSTLIDTARRLVKLYEEPEPGLATWHMMVQRCYEDFRNNVFAEEARRKGDRVSEPNNQHEPMKKGDRVHRPGRPKRGCTPEIEEYYGTVLHVGFVSIERDGNPGFLVYEQEKALSLIPDEPPPEWETIVSQEIGYTYRWVDATFQRRKLSNATKPGMPRSQS